MSQVGTGFKLMDSYAEFTLDPSQFISALGEVERATNASMRATEQSTKAVMGAANMTVDQLAESVAAMERFEKSAAAVPERTIQPWRALTETQRGNLETTGALGRATGQAAGTFGTLSQAIGGAIRGIEGMDKAQKNMLSGASQIAQSALYGGLTGGAIGAAAMGATALISKLFESWAEGAAEAAAKTQEAINTLRAYLDLAGKGPMNSALSGIRDAAGAYNQDRNALELQQTIAKRATDQAEAMRAAVMADREQPASQRTYTQFEGSDIMASHDARASEERERLRMMAMGMLRDISDRVGRTTGDMKVKALDDLIATMSEFAKSEDTMLREAVQQFTGSDAGSALSAAYAERNRAAAEAATQAADKDFDERKRAIEEERLKRQSESLQKMLDSTFKDIADFAKGARQKAEQLQAEAEKQHGQQIRDMIAGQDDLAKLLFRDGAKAIKPRMTGLEETHQFIQDQIFSADDPAKQTAANTAEIAESSQRMAEDVSKIANQQGMYMSVYGT